MREHSRFTPPSSTPGGEWIVEVLGDLHFCVQQALEAAWDADTTAHTARGGADVAEWRRATKAVMGAMADVTAAVARATDLARVADSARRDVVKGAEA